MHLTVEKLDPEMATPSYANAGDAGLDLYASEMVTVEPGCRAPVPLGVKVAIPESHVGLLVPKSGRAKKEGLSQVNTPGIIDSGFRGELTFLAYNEDADYPIVIKRNEKCCQLVVVPIPQVELVIGKVDADTERGEGDFGSSGLE